MWTKTDFCAVILVTIYFVDVSSSTSILRTAPRALFDLAASASTSASQATAPLSNFRRRQDKAAQLKQESGLTEQEDLLVENQDISGATNDSSVETGNNEASPGILQKKINKLVAKLNFIAQLKSAFHGPIDTSEEPEATTTSPVTSMVKITFEDPITDNVKVSENIQQIPNVKHNLPKDDGSGDGPERIDLEVNEVTREVVRKKPRSDEINEEPVGGFDRVRLFFAGMLGRIISLTYGAFGRF